MLRGNMFRFVTFMEINILCTRLRVGLGLHYSHVICDKSPEGHYYSNACISSHLKMPSYQEGIPRIRQVNSSTLVS